MAGLRMMGVAVAIGGCISVAGAATVYSEGFNGQLDGASPKNGVTPWYSSVATDSSVAITTSVGNPVPALKLSDTGNASGGAITELNLGSAATAFDMSNPAQGVVTFTFDFRVDEFQSTNNSGSNTRIAIKDGNGTGTDSNDDRYLIMGIAVASVNDGTSGGSNDLFLYAAGSTTNFLSSVVESNAIGLNVGSGWATGFDFGNFTTLADADTNDQFYRIAMKFTAGSTNVLVTATQLDALGAATANVASKSVTVAAPLMLSNTGSDGFGFYTGTSGRGVAYFDNIQITTSAVPEPAWIGAAALAGVAIARRRRRA